MMTKNTNNIGIFLGGILGIFKCSLVIMFVNISPFKEENVIFCVRNFHL